MSSIWNALSTPETAWGSKLSRPPVTYALSLFRAVSEQLFRSALHRAALSLFRFASVRLSACSAQFLSVAVHAIDTEIRRSRDQKSKNLRAQSRFL